MPHPKPSNKFGYVACLKAGRFLRHDDGSLRRYRNPQAARYAAIETSRERTSAREVPVSHLSDHDLADGIADANDDYSRRWP